MEVCSVWLMQWIEELENRDWIIEHSEELLAFYGEEPFWADDPVPIKGDYRSLQSADPEAAAQAVVEGWLEELGLPYQGATVASMEEPGIYFDIEKDILHLDLNEQDLKSEYMPAVIALAVAALFISMKRPEEGQGWSQEEEMPIHTLVAILLGFGPYICEAELRRKQQPEDTEQSEDSTTLAFDSGLSLEECCFAQAYVSFIFEQDFTSYQNRFSPESRELVAQALSYMMQMEQSQQEQ